MTALIDENALFKIQYGMYVISTKFGDKLNGQIVTTLMQVTNDPIQVAVCLSKNTLTHEMIFQSKIFAASILGQTAPMTFIGKFGYKSGRNFYKFHDTKFEQNITGCPLVLDNTVVVMEAKIKSSLDVKTHTIFVGELLSSKTVADGEAMTYEYYHRVMRGKSPENAPTFINSK